MALNFPTSPEIGKTYTLDGRRYFWDGIKWLGSQGGITKVEMSVNLFDHYTSGTDIAPFNPDSSPDSPDMFDKLALS